MIAVRAVRRLCSDLLAYGWSTGRWWLPVVTVAFGVAALLALTAKTVIIPALYVMF